MDCGRVAFLVCLIQCHVSKICSIFTALHEHRNTNINTPKPTATQHKNKARTYSGKLTFMHAEHTMHPLVTIFLL